MSPLTSPSGCISCACLADKIAEMELIMSMLYQIQEAKRLMDKFIFSPEQTDTTCAQQPDASAPGSAADSAICPVIVPDESWVQLRGRPKAPISSTPSHHKPWSRVSVHSKGGMWLCCTLPNHGIQLENKFNIPNFFWLGNPDLISPAIKWDPQLIVAFNPLTTHTWTLPRLQGFLPHTTPPLCPPFKVQS